MTDKQERLRKVRLKAVRIVKTFPRWMVEEVEQIRKARERKKPTN